MAAPSLGILQDFNGADGAISGWSRVTGVGNDMEIVGNQGGNAAGANAGGPTTPTYGPDFEWYFTVPVVSGFSVRLMAMHANRTSDNYDGYEVEFYSSGIDLIRYDAGSYNALGTGALTWGNGDAIGLVKVGSTLEMWHKPNGGSWTLMDSATDTTYNTAFHFGVRVANGTARIDNAGGGTLSASGPNAATLAAYRRNHLLMEP
jgi:hypothetical protein